MSEHHLETIVDRLQGEFQIQVAVGAPQVAYRETFTRPVLQDTTHKKRASPISQFARVLIRFDPLPRGSGFVFENRAAENAVPMEYLPGVESGLSVAKESGVIAGFPIIDFKATLIDGAHHEVESSIMAFQFATLACFREAMPKVGPQILEPIMKVEVMTPAEYLGDVIGDLQSRRGPVGGIETRGGAELVTALVPLANLFGYRNSLDHLTARRGSCEMSFAHYQPPPYRVV
jgi:elongation factor G